MKKEVLPPTLDDLLNDERLARLFSSNDRPCALQLWILQIKTGDSLETHVLYGRLLPYSYASDSWYESYDDNFPEYGKVRARVLRATLYLKSRSCPDLLRHLCAGKTVSGISKEMGLTLPEKIAARIGDIALTADKLVYRPVSYLLNRDAHVRDSLSSPHGEAGTLSASITRSDKCELFRLKGEYDDALTNAIVKELKVDTGLEFGSTDATRLGDIELLVFPSLDDQERSLLSVTWADAPYALIARFKPMQVPGFTGFQVRLNIENDGQVVYSHLATATLIGSEEYECKFEVSDNLRHRIDCTEVDFFGTYADATRQSSLCCRWRMHYIRQIDLQGHMVGGGSSAIKFDWLEKAAPAKKSERVEAALAVSRGNAGFSNLVGTREADPWVTGNRNLADLFARLHPPKSEGQFFQRYSEDDGEGRLQFVEWFRGLLMKYGQHQIVIFDPYFETAGLVLLMLRAEPNSDYLVFTTLPKIYKPDRIKLLAIKFEDLCRRADRLRLRLGSRLGLRPPIKANEDISGDADKPPIDRINNLLASCENQRHILRHLKLRIFGLKGGWLHDRYILVMAPDKLPVAGFHLSNSFQKAAENYPLLVTPIPADVLLKVEKYKLGLVQEAETASADTDTENPTMQLLFDSKSAKATPISYEPLRFLERALAGDVLGDWTGVSSLRGLSGAALKTQMAAAGLIVNDNALTFPETATLPNYLRRRSGTFTDFAPSWDVLSDVLAHSGAGDRRSHGIEAEKDFLAFLSGYLKDSFPRSLSQDDKELAVTNARLFREKFETLLRTGYHPDHLFRPTKFAALSWSEYFAIQLLWWHAPEVLLAIAEDQSALVPEKAHAADAVRLSLLSQIVSEIALSLQFEISAIQRESLLRRKNGLLRWLGMNAIERQLDKPNGLADVLQRIASFPYADQIQALGWLIQHTAGNKRKEALYNDLVAALLKALPAIVSATELVSLVDSMRGHMGWLTAAEPWLFKDVIYPLLERQSVAYDDACEIWTTELINLLDPNTEKQGRLFNRRGEGQFTNIAALLFASSSPVKQKASLRAIESILKKYERIVRQPLASTSNWSRWNDGLEVLMWILTYTRWTLYYLHAMEKPTKDMEDFSNRARGLAMLRPIEEWRSRGPGGWQELAAFLDQAEGLLASSNTDGAVQ